MREERKVWKILLVDDDEDVIKATQYSLDGLKVLGRRIEIDFCLSARDAMQLLSKDRDFAVIMVDVIMEYETAGLDLIESVRSKFEMETVRLIVRTGQAGQFKQRDVVASYEIDDYIEKNTATRERLETAMSTAIRAYSHLEKCSRLNNALQQIIKYSNSLAETDDFYRFGETCLEGIASLFGKRVTCTLAFQGKLSDGEVIPLTTMSKTVDDVIKTYEPGDPLAVSGSERTPSQRMQRVGENGISEFLTNDIYLCLNVPAHGRTVIHIYREDEFDETDFQIARQYQTVMQVNSSRLSLMRERMREAVMAMGVLAHEFRTPISSLRISNEFMLDAVESGEIKVEKFKTLLKNNGQVLERMTSNIDLSMKNIGVVMKTRLALPNRRENISNIIKSVLAVHAHAFSHAGEIIAEVEDECYALVEKETFEQVVVNLMSNAVKALSARQVRASGPQIEVRLTKNEGNIYLAIKDQGVGISKENLRQIFDPFFTSHATPSHGLGLTMVRKSIKAMDGDVRCTSDLGIGTTFTLTLKADNT